MIVTYKGVRTSGHDTAGDTYVAVFAEQDGVSAGHELRPSRRGLQHSPDGHNWGYSGSGPACLAHSLLTNALGPYGADAADKLYQTFKDEFVAKWPIAGWEIGQNEIRDWAAKKLAELNTGQG